MGGRTRHEFPGWTRHLSRSQRDQSAASRSPRPPTHNTLLSLSTYSPHLALLIYLLTTPCSPRLPDPLAATLLFGFARSAGRGYAAARLMSDSLHLSLPPRPSPPSLAPSSSAARSPSHPPSHSPTPVLITPSPPHPPRPPPSQEPSCSGGSSCPSRAPSSSGPRTAGPPAPPPSTCVRNVLF